MAATGSQANSLDHSRPESLLAGRAVRLWASLIDLILVLLVMAPGMWLLFRAGLRSGFVAHLIAVLLCAVAFVALNFRLLDQRGQTIGKKLLGLQIAGRNDRMIPVRKLLRRRYFPLFAVLAIPLAGPVLVLINLLMTFRHSRGCLHDDLANTKVIQL